MILLDLNQLAITSLLMHHKNGAEINMELVRPVILNLIRINKLKFQKFGEVVICCDDSHYWRKEVFPYYKAHRSEERKKSTVDWKNLFDCIETVRDEIKIMMPYRTIQVNRAEADDIIAALAEKFSTSEEITLIVSGDKDFGQLQKFGNVRQYSPRSKQYITVEDPQSFLKEHIIRGDKGDGIPNMLSPAATFMSPNIRQTSITKEVLANLMSSDLKNHEDETTRVGYERNLQLIDFTQIPREIANAISVAYDEYNIPKRGNIFNYFIKKRLSTLIPCVNEF